jgi:small subunit ribosomal protein S20
MANTRQARKRSRQARAQNEHNTALRSRLRTAIKKVRKAIASGDKAQADAQYRVSTSVIDSIADKKIVHKNLAARNKSRLAAAIKAMA